MNKPLTLTLEQLREEPYSAVLCYPKPAGDELDIRLAELQGHGVTTVELSGKTNAYGIPAPILGKGYVGIVVIANLKGQRIALKIRRLDAGRVDLVHEAQMLQKANTVNVGPKFVGVSKNFLLMQLIDGDLLPTWLKTHQDKAEVQMVLSDLLDQCFRLDKIGLDHGELSKAPKHVIVDRQGKPWIVDFETASDARRPANVPAICHFLFASSGEVAQTVALSFGDRCKEVVDTLKVYKRSLAEDTFELVLKACFGSR